MPAPDRLLDRPTWAPSWFPSIDGGPGLRWLRRAIAVVFVVGVASCVGEGADTPADPSLGAVDVGVDVTDPGRSTVCATPAGEFDAETAQLTEQFGTTTVRLTTGDETLELCVLVASDTDQRARGLMTVTGFDGFDGMLFTYDADSDGPYYMFNTPTPLTIYWWDAEGALVSSTGMEPCLDRPPAECPRYPPDGPYRAALEVPFGALEGLVDDDTHLEIAPAG